MSKKVLFIALHRPMRSPSQRFRFEQYIDFLSDNGFDCKQVFLLNAKQDKTFYSQGHYIGKVWILILAIVILFREAFFRKYDIVYVQREAFMLGTAFFEQQFAKKSKLIFDFDDAIWIPVVSANNQSLSFLKDASKTSKIIAAADMVFTGNQYLLDYASDYNQNVKIIPTTLDTNYHKKRDSKKNNKRICIGWSGSFSTVPHFEEAIPLLLQLKEKYGDIIYFKLIGDANFSHKELNIQGIDWQLETEIKDLEEFDIGIMPLPDDQWTKGKCAFKGLSYMAMSIPTVMSAVGLNSVVIQDGENGFLVSETSQWVQKLSLLIESKELREKIGANGRKTVEKKYSVEANKRLYLQYFNEILNN